MTDDSITSNPSKKRKANDGRATLADGGGGFLSSLFGYYFSGSRYDTSSSADQHGNNTNNDRFMQQTLSHMERMEQSMQRMEEKLSKLSSVERRCEELEAKCSSLEAKLDSKCSSLDTKLASTSQSLKDHVDSTSKTLLSDLDNKCSSLKHKLDCKVSTLELKGERALMLLEQNKKWEYPVAIDYNDLMDYGEEEGKFLMETAKALKEKTIEMRAGRFPDFNNDDAIVLIGDVDGEWYTSNILLPHWVEFAAALKQFNPETATYNNNDGVSSGPRYKSRFKFGNFQLEKRIFELIKDALIEKPFGMMRFIHNQEVCHEQGGLCIDAILDIVESNHGIRRLDILYNDISACHVERLCSTVESHYGLKELDLDRCCSEPGVGDAILTTLLANSQSELFTLFMQNNFITSNVSTVLAEFLAVNRKLAALDLSGNKLNDNDAALIASALRNNTALMCLHLDGNDVSWNGMERAFRPLLFDESSLNAMADSNHVCNLLSQKFEVIEYDFNLNCMERYMNRARKIYFLLSCRNRTESNTQDFDDIDVEILPYMLESVQKYETIVNDRNNKNVGSCLDRYRYDLTVGSLSIVYEVMRKWEKVFSLYE